MNTQILYRPVGLKELELVADSGWKAFPPRLDWQPIFYPVLNQAYAEQIAQEWNTLDAFSGYCGIVTRFEVQATYILNFKVENVGAAMHNELWVPAEELTNFNKHISGTIEIISAFFGLEFTETLHEEVNKKLLKFIP